MSADRQMDTSTCVAPEEATTHLSNTVVKKEDVHERPLTSSSNNSEHIDLEKQRQPDDSMPPVQPAKSTTESVYPGPKQRAAVMVSLLLSMFLVALDRTIIATAIPKMTDDFHSLNDVGWYGSAFMLTSCCFQLLLGRIYTFYTPKYVFLSLVLFFEVGSAICGAAPNSIAFIFGRAIAGIGSAGLTSGAIVLMVDTIPLNKRPMYQGMFGGVFGVASVVGPLLGGVFTTKVSWRWCFYINLPLGAIVVVPVWFLLKANDPKQKGLTIKQQLGKLDLLGNLFLFPCIVCLLLALQWGGSTYSWSNGRIIALFVLFGVLFICFAAVQYYKPETATIPRRILVNRSILGGMLYAFCIASNMFLLVYYLPFWFQAIKGVSAIHSGIDTIPLVLALVVGAISAGQLTTRIGYYTPWIYTGAVIAPIGAGLMMLLNLHTGEGKWIGYQIVAGFGIGVGMQQPSVAAQTVLARADVPSGVSMMFFVNMLGGAVFVSVGQNVLDSHLIASLTKIVPGFTPGAIINTGATAIRGAVPAHLLHEVLVAYNLALRQVFMVSTVVASLSVLGAACIEWRSVKGKQGAQGAQGASEKSKEVAEKPVEEMPSEEKTPEEKPQ